MGVIKSIIHFILGFPIIVGKCSLCNFDGSVFDLGDDDKVCKPCWDNYVPSYMEHETWR